MKEDKASEKFHLGPGAKGAIAGIASRTISAPIDLLKIRYQMSQTSASSDAPFLGKIRKSISNVYRYEGLSGFWKGNMAGIYLYAAYGAVQFRIYEGILPTFKDNYAFSKGVAGAIAAMGATFVSYPFDLIRTRHTLQHTAAHQKHYRGIVGTVKTIAREEGLKGFYKGILPSLVQVVPYMGLAFASFDYAKQTFKQWNWPPNQVDFVAGAISGLISKTLLMPVDTIRKRLQIQGSSYSAYTVRDLPIYHGLLDCISTIWRKEGFKGYFKGLGLALTKAVPATMTIFVVYGALECI